MTERKVLVCPRRHVSWTLGALVLILVSLSFGAGAWWMNRHAAENPAPLVDITRKYVPQEHFIINIQPLREWINRYVAENGPDRISIYLEVLNTGSNVSVNKELQLFPASLMKIPIAMVALRKVQDGDIKLDDVVSLKQHHLNSDSGPLYKRGAGARLTIRELLEALLLESDNTAYFVLLEMASQEELNGIVDEVGLLGLFDNTTGAISAKEYSRFFRALYTSSFLDPEHSQFILEMLTRSAFKEFLSGGLPGDVLFAHKYGEHIDRGVYLDSGIVYVPNRPYLITVMIKEEEGDLARAKAGAGRAMSEISAKVYEYIKNYKR